MQLGWLLQEREEIGLNWFSFVCPLMNLGCGLQAIIQFPYMGRESADALYASTDPGDYTLTSQSNDWAAPRHSK